MIGGELRSDCQTYCTVRLYSLAVLDTSFWLFEQIGFRTDLVQMGAIFSIQPLALSDPPVKDFGHPRIWHLKSQE